MFRVSSVVVPCSFEMHEESHDGKVRAAVPANTDFFKNSLRLLIFIFPDFYLGFMIVQIIGFLKNSIYFSSNG